MNKVLEVSQADMDARVQPGVTREALNEELRATGLFFPVDPGANASLGGMAMTRASGTTAVRYGTMRDNVLGLEVVLADGRVIRTGTRARKSSAGLRPDRAFGGLRGHAGPRDRTDREAARPARGDLGGGLRLRRSAQAVDAVIATIQMGIPMARIEFVDAATAAAFNAYAGAACPRCRT
jgi:D-lactate dehydrogenase (cytochrome)